MIKSTEEAKRNVDNLIEKGDYIVFLPQGIDIRGYDKIPKIAETYAQSEREAVSYVLSKRNRGEGLTNSNVRIAMSILDDNFGGAEKYAVLIPETDNYDLIDYVIANELAAKEGSNDISEYIQKARFLLKGVNKLS